MNWKTILAAGTIILFAGIAASAFALPKVAVYVTEDTVGTSDVVSKIWATGLFESVDNLDPDYGGSSPSPTLATLEQYDAVLVGSMYPLQDPTELGNVLADYVDGGGRVVVGMYTLGGSGTSHTIGGRFYSGGYFPVELDVSERCRSNIIGFAIDIPNHTLLEGVNSLGYRDDTQTNCYSQVSPVAGATQVAHWLVDTGTEVQAWPLVVFKDGVVVLNFQPSSADADSGQGWDPATDGARLMANALLFREVSDPEELMLNVISYVIALNLQQGISNSLDAKLSSALEALTDMNENNAASALNRLSAFINEVEAQRGNKISDTDADYLINAAQEIIDLF